MARRRLAVVLLGAAQVLVVFDTTAFAIALPWISARSHLSVDGLTWLITVYSVCFAALPVLAVALGEAFGQRRVLMGGLVLSSAAAAASGVTQGAGVLLTSRAVQGVAAAAITAGAVALIESTHPEGRGRDRALSVHFVVVAAAGPAVVLPSTVLLETMESGAGVFWAQAVVGVLLLVLVPLALTESAPGPGARSRVGRAAAAVVPLGFLAWFAGWLVDHSVSPTTIIALAAAGALTPSSLSWLGRRGQEPSLLTRLYQERAALGAYTVVALLAACLTGAGLVLTIALQTVGGLSPESVGWALLPAVVGLVLGWLTLPLFAARAGLAATVAVACGVTAAGFVLLSREGAGYQVADVLPPLLLIAYGCGVLALPVSFARSGSGALPRGLNSSRQLGAGLGASLFSGVVTVVLIDLRSMTFHSAKEYNAALADRVPECFELGVALALTAAVVALLTLPWQGVRTTSPDPDASDGAPAGTAGSPGSSGP
ncbi:MULTISPECIES: MFS transporter [unclassified Streptomyces]|uniref:MFS transporter n=1 Tax=unclassified Streptomyces TaxID=2593676 RepID=UPI0011A85D9C|nr:MFS transporter [Streptomyces sp. BK340]TVZ96258.1 MFS transporter [Streptomyces sp. BK340]